MTSDTMTSDDRADDTRAELLALEHAGWQSLCDGTATTFYEHTLAADALMVIVTGEILDRAGVLRTFAAAPSWARYEISEPRLVVLDDAVAVLVYRGHGWRDASEAPFLATMTSTYRRHGDGWQLVLYQQSTVT